MEAGSHPGPDTQFYHLIGRTKAQIHSKRVNQTVVKKEYGQKFEGLRNPALPPLDQGGPETPGHEDFTHLFTPLIKKHLGVPATG